jgi:hypothetical protein
MDNTEFVCDNLLINKDTLPSTNSPVNFDIKPFLSEIAKIIGLENIDSLLNSSDSFNYDEFVKTLKTINTGDPRYTLGEMYVDVFNMFSPQIAQYTEIVQSGGCQIIENYICDENGNRIKEYTNTCNSENAGNISPQDIFTFVKKTYTEKVDSHVNGFIDFLKAKKDVNLFSFKNYPIFYAQVGENYYKYYEDQKQNVSTQLGVQIQIVNDDTTLSQELINILSEPILNY